MPTKKTFLKEQLIKFKRTDLALRYRVLRGVGVVLCCGVL